MAHARRRHRVLVFDACRTGDHENTLRKTQGFDTKQMDLIGTKRSVGFKAQSQALMAFLDSGDPFIATGMGDNPWC